jgi:hypothetical protein
METKDMPVLRTHFYQPKASMLFYGDASSCVLQRPKKQLKIHLGFT